MLWSDLERFGNFWNPWRELDQMERTLSRLVPPSRVEFPAVNVWVDEDSALVTTEIPGVDPQSIDISVVRKSLTLRGLRQPEELQEGEP
jgi:HSP20 family protein